MCVPALCGGTGSFVVVGLFGTEDTISSGNGSTEAFFFGTVAFLSGGEQHVQDQAVAVRLRGPIM